MTLFVCLRKKKQSIISPRKFLFDLVLGSPFDLSSPVYIIATINKEVLARKRVCHWKPQGMNRPLSYVSPPALSLPGPELHCSHIQVKNDFFTPNRNNVSVFMNPRDADTSAHIYIHSAVAVKLHMLF